MQLQACIVVCPGFWATPTVSSTKRCRYPVGFCKPHTLQNGHAHTTCRATAERWLSKVVAAGSKGKASPGHRRVGSTADEDSRGAFHRRYASIPSDTIFLVSYGVGPGVFEICPNYTYQPWPSRTGNWRAIAGRDLASGSSPHPQSMKHWGQIRAHFAFLLQLPALNTRGGRGRGGKGGRGALLAGLLRQLQQWSQVDSLRSMRACVHTFCLFSQCLGAYRIGVVVKKGFYHTGFSPRLTQNFLISGLECVTCECRKTSTAASPGGKAAKNTAPLHVLVDCIAQLGGITEAQNSIHANMPGQVMSLHTTQCYIHGRHSV